MYEHLGMFTGLHAGAVGRLVGGAQTYEKTGLFAGWPARDQEAPQGQPEQERGLASAEGGGRERAVRLHLPRLRAIGLPLLGSRLSSLAHRTSA